MGRERVGERKWGEERCGESGRRHGVREWRERRSERIGREWGERERGISKWGERESKKGGGRE